MKLKTILLPLFMLLPILCMSETSRHLQIYHAYVSGNMDQWVSVVKEIEKDETIKTVSQKLELVEYYYGLTPFYIDTKNEKMARYTIQKADIVLDKLLKTAPENPTAQAFKGAFIGFKISLDKFKVLTLGPESLKHINLAYSLDPSDIQALTDKANAFFHAPKMFGGDKIAAVKFYQKSIVLMERSNLATHNWFYLNTLILLAKAYVSIDQTNDAKIIYEKALRKEPDFVWVKTVLYPRLLKQMNK